MKKIGLFNITKKMYSILIGLKSYSGAGGSCNYHFIFKKDLSIPDNNFFRLLYIMKLNGVNKKSDGAPARIRTADLLITNQLLKFK